MKRILGILCAGMIAASALTVQAAPETAPNLIVNYAMLDGQVLVDKPTPLAAIENELVRSYAIASISASIQKENGAIAGCAGSVDLRISGCTVKAELSIARSDDGKSWSTKKRKSFTATQRGVTADSFIYYMTRGHYYRATLTANTYDENGAYRDYMSVSSDDLYY